MEARRQLLDLLIQQCWIHMNPYGIHMDSVNYWINTIDQLRTSGRLFPRRSFPGFWNSHFVRTLKISIWNQLELIAGSERQSRVPLMKFTVMNLIGWYSQLWTSSDEIHKMKFIQFEGSSTGISFLPISESINWPSVSVETCNRIRYSGLFQIGEGN